MYIYMKTGRELFINYVVRGNLLSFQFVERGVGSAPVGPSLYNIRVICWHRDSEVRIWTDTETGIVVGRSRFYEGSSALSFFESINFYILYRVLM